MHISRNLLNVPTKYSKSKVRLTYYTTGVSFLGVPGILAEQLNLFQLGGTGYVHLITTGTPDGPVLQRHFENAFAKRAK